MTPAEATLWLIASPFIIIGGGAILAIAIRAFSPEAQVQLYAPVKAWAGAHPLAFRTLIVLGGWALARIAGGVLSLVATLALAVWVFVLVIRYWQTPWVLPAWRFVKASALDLWDWAWARFNGIPEQQRRVAARRAADFAIEAKSVDVAIAADSPEGDSQLVAQLTAWDEEIERLLTLPRRRTKAENDQLSAMSKQRQAMQAQLLGAGAIPAAPLAAFGSVGNRQGFFGPVAAIAGGKLWIAGAAVFVALLGALGFQTARLDHAKDDLREARSERDAALQYGNDMAALAERRNQDVANVREENADSRDLIESVQSRNARLEARERERNRLAQENNNAAAVDFSDRLRDLTIQPLLSAPAPSGDPASGVPDATGSDPDA